MGFAIRAAEGYIVAIEADYGNAEELKAFLNDVADLEGAGHYTLAEATQADYDELEVQKSLYAGVDVD
jgi:hypothetical protein